MKTIIKLTLIAASLASIGTTAHADDQQLQNRLAKQQDTRRAQTTTTIAVYADRHGVSHRSAMQDDVRSEVRFEWRTTPRGQGIGAYVPVK